MKSKLNSQSKTWQYADSSSNEWNRLFRGKHFLSSFVHVEGCMIRGSFQNEKYQDLNVASISPLSVMHQISFIRLSASDCASYEMF